MLSYNLQYPPCFLANFLALPALPTVLLSSQFLTEPIMRIFISLSFTIKTVRNVSTTQGTGFQSCWLLPAETSKFQGMSTEMFNIFLSGKGKVFRCIHCRAAQQRFLCFAFPKDIIIPGTSGVFFSQYAVRLIFRVAAMLWKINAVKVACRRNRQNLPFLFDQIS